MVREYSDLFFFSANIAANSGQYTYQVNGIIIFRLLTPLIMIYINAAIIYIKISNQGL